MVETLPIAKIYGSAKHSPWGQSGIDATHLYQVRYAIRRHRIEKDGKIITFFYVFDKKTNSIPEWAEVLFPLRGYAVGCLQHYLEGLSPKKRSELSAEWEKSLTTFTERQKACFIYPN